MAAKLKFSNAILCEHVVSGGSGKHTLINVYGGDILALPRRRWDPATLEEHPLDWVLYESFARVASAAACAPG